MSLTQKTSLNDANRQLLERADRETLLTTITTLRDQVALAHEHLAALDDIQAAQAHQIEALRLTRQALRDLIDAIPNETLAADRPLEIWVEHAEAALASVGGE